MFSFAKTTCYAKYFFTAFKKNVSKNTNFFNYSALSSRNEQQWKNGTLLQLNKYQSTTEENELPKFMAVFPEIVKDLTVPDNIVVPDVAKWLSEVFQYNVLHRKKSSSLILLQSYKMMAKPEDQTAENIHLVMILGWCIEMLHAGVVISDDVIDGSETRQGVPCWYKKDGVGLSAINDSSLLTGGGYAILRKYFRDQPNYVDILEIFQDMYLKTAIGQSLDCCTAQQKRLDLFTLEHYKSIIKYKSVFALLFLPVKLAMCLAGCPSEMKQAETCLIDLASLCQIVNDYVDCYGDPAVTGKDGTDIQEGKCTWLAVTALQKASPEQRKIMEECYGSPDPQKVAAIKNLYKDLNMPNEFAVFRNKFTNDIQFEIQKISNEKVQNLMSKIYEILAYWIIIEI